MRNIRVVAANTFREAVRDRVLSANAYIGSVPIVEALQRGANIVITGRSTDTALTMAPLRHEFGWAADDWNRLAAGIITETEASQLRDYDRRVMELVHVDDFEPHELGRRLAPLPAPLSQQVA